MLTHPPTIFVIRIIIKSYVRDFVDRFDSFTDKLRRKPYIERVNITKLDNNVVNMLNVNIIH
ncbi:hypothetical protein SOASR030_03630 [Leminorella grimontii]|uniref:Uncharacterized protein n=1 Tax=Leminorella grimontii TaxID=82981 RepID=A0AAV5MWQ3_9GAMM|nr:hypothetical protein SOASR030_03630 [Leminorella grimontii]GKX57692.1 hypothetical protein SOASR031_00070 [Leminorella grimontii]